VTTVIQTLLNSAEATVRYKVRTALLDSDPISVAMLSLREEIRTSPRVQNQLAGRDMRHPYKKWRGAHWILPSLADLAYPAGDMALLPLFEEDYNWLFNKQRQVIQGRVRSCASQEGNALYAACALGLADERSGLVWYARISGDPRARASVERAAEVFLQRRLYKGRHSGAVIEAEFTQLHYPCYWHYDILFGLKVLGEAGLLDDPRCADALDLLETKRLPDGGWPAEKAFYRVSEHVITGSSAVGWGPTGHTRMNEWITLDALAILKLAGRAWAYKRLPLGEDLKK
jgi:hypothetical protein